MKMEELAQRSVMEGPEHLRARVLVSTPVIKEVTVASDTAHPNTVDLHLEAQVVVLPCHASTDPGDWIEIEICQELDPPDADLSPQR